MRHLAIALLLAAAVLLAGCGTAYYGMPPRTLQKDEMSYGVGITWNSLEPWGDWRGCALNGHVWWGVNDSDAMGLNFSHVDLPLFFPEFSYAHSWAPDGDGRRLVGSVHASLALDWNPGLEGGLGVSRESGRFAHLAWVGAGLWRDGTVTPSLRYVAQTGELRGEVGWMPGRMATALRVAKGFYYDRRDRAILELTRDEIASVQPPPADSWWGRGDDGVVVTPHDGGSIEITTRDPYVCDWYETWRRGFIDRFPPEPGVKMWWVYDERGEDYDPQRDFPAEVDLDRVLARYEREGVLVVERDPAVIEQAVARYDQWWRDLTVGAWWAWYGPLD